MTTLARVSDITKKAIIIAIGSILGLMVLTVSIGLLGQLKEKLFPTPPPPPTVTFGKVSDIVFPKSIIDTNFTYSINTISGTLPSFADRVTVYKLMQPQPNFQALTSVQNLANLIGFTGQPKTLSETQYQWQDTTMTPPATFTIDSLSQDFTYTTDFLNDPTVNNPPQTITPQIAINKAQGFLNILSLFPDDIDMSKTQTKLLTITNGQLTPVTSLSDEKIIQVDFFQNDVNKLPIVYPNPSMSTMSFLIGSEASDGTVLKANFSHKEILSDFNGTYPIKSVTTAFSELKNGEGYIASYNGNNTSVTIQNVYLAYYIGTTSQQYLLPVIIFQGDNGFTAYVSAISPQWVSK